MKNISIIGAGIIGASIGFELAKNGARVTIVDREDFGQATKAAAGIICPWTSQRRNKRWYKLAMEGAKHYPSLITELKDLGEMDTGYDKVGAISPHDNPEKLEAMVKRTLKRKDEAPEIGDVTILSEQDSKALFPPLADGYQSVHVSGAARVDGWALRNSLLSAAKKLGAVVLQEDCSLMLKNSSVIGIETKHQKIHADEVIITAGVWANELLRPLQMTINLSFQKGQIIHLQMPGINSDLWPVVMPPHDQYILSLTGNRIVIGATHENDEVLDYRLTMAGMKEIMDKALKFAPGLHNSTFIEAKVGFRPFTADFLPIFGRLPGHKNVIFANGLGASGLTMGPFLGQQLAKLALDNEPDIHLADYALDEFISSK
ncbi:NAD(P)/FAD-dependent oxidoreductase [Niallia taxi]|uniref:FAD-dependent oxidoreductase n=1 Tax=Niallia taxi TaxID=2499688 RepID=A0A3S2UYR3_9BACI|nr:FAD-binding oxidoreductase [Niallia taxi]RVT67316.1 FAD-dependent oxidoreductase [Niallia taxi]